MILWGVAKNSKNKTKIQQKQQQQKKENKQKTKTTNKLLPINIFSLK